MFYTVHSRYSFYIGIKKLRRDITIDIDIEYHCTKNFSKYKAHSVSNRINWSEMNSGVSHFTMIARHFICIATLFRAFPRELYDCFSRHGSHAVRKTLKRLYESVDTSRPKFFQERYGAGAKNSS